jgi:hypothetical protein
MMVISLKVSNIDSKSSATESATRYVAQGVQVA